MADGLCNPYPECQALMAPIVRMDCHPNSRYLQELPNRQEEEGMSYWTGNPNV